MSKVDLHLHTNLSDGLISPEDVVIKAKNNDCKIISITDHELLNEYDALAKKYNLLETYGSDFHNPETDYIGIEINQDNCEKIRESMVLRRKI